MVALFDVANNYTPLLTFSAHQYSPTSYFVRLSFCSVAGSSLLVTGSQSEIVAKIWDLSDATDSDADPRALSPVAVLRGTSIIQDLRFSGDGGVIATACHDHTVKLWDTYSRQLLNTLSGHSNWVFGAVFHPTDSGTLLSCGMDGSVRVWKA